MENYNELLTLRNKIENTLNYRFEGIQRKKLD